MSAQDNGGPAFPESCNDTGFAAVVSSGMTLRDYFAAKAMQGLIVASAAHTGSIDGDRLVVNAYGFADAMLKARQS